MALALVTNAPTTLAPSSDKPTPTPEENAVLSAYIQDLKRRGFCQLTDASSPYPRLFNRFNRTVLPECFIASDFRRWLRKTHQECRLPSTGYVSCALTLVVGSRFYPASQPFLTDRQTELTYVNTYRAYQPNTTSKEVSPLFLEYFGRLLPDERERHIVLQWLAHIFQRPEQRPSWHVLLRSEPGTGKGFLVQEILRPLLNHTSVLSDYSQVMSRFSSALEDNLLVLLDDCKAKSDATQTQLKSLLSEERAYVERKGLQGGMVDTYTRFILASNEDKPLHLEASERRWFVTERLVHHQDREETQAFIQRLADWLALPDSLCKVYNYFMTYPLDGFNAKCVPDSAGLAAIVDASKNPHAEFIGDFISEHTVFTYKELRDAFIAEGMTPPNDRQVPHLLREAGYEKTKPRIDGKETRICHPIGMELEAIRAAWAARTAF